MKCFSALLCFVYIFDALSYDYQDGSITTYADYEYYDWDNYLDKAYEEESGFMHRHLDNITDEMNTSSPPPVESSTSTILNGHLLGEVGEILNVTERPTVATTVSTTVPTTVSTTTRFTTEESRINSEPLLDEDISISSPEDDSDEEDFQGTSPLNHLMERRRHLNKSLADQHQNGSLLHTVSRFCWLALFFSYFYNVL